MRWGRLLGLGGVLGLMLLLQGPVLRHAVLLASEPPRNRCASNLRQLGRALRMYCQDYDGVYPPAKGWSTNVSPYVRSLAVFKCPLEKRGDGFAYNSLLSGRPEASIPEAVPLPALFESRLLTPGSAGTARDVAQPPRHGGRNLYYFTNDRLEWLQRVPDFGKPYVPPRKGKSPDGA